MMFLWQLRYLIDNCNCAPFLVLEWINHEFVSSDAIEVLLCFLSYLLSEMGKSCWSCFQKSDSNRQCILWKFSDSCNNAKAEFWSSIYKVVQYFFKRLPSPQEIEISPLAYINLYVERLYSRSEEVLLCSLAISCMNVWFWGKVLFWNRVFQKCADMICASVAVAIYSHGTPIKRVSNFIMRKFNNVSAVSFL